jgi:hypothetical protein
MLSAAERVEVCVMRSFKKILGGGVILIAVFCVSFFIFYKKTQKTLATHLILTPAVINQPLPDARLVNLSGQLLDDEKLRRGRVVLVFTLNECPPCAQENEFLKTAAGNNQKVRFFDVIPFGQKELALKEAQASMRLKRSSTSSRCSPAVCKSIKCR